MIKLQNGCYCSGTPGDPSKGTPDLLSVNPKNWESKKASVKKDWYIHYRFYDPSITTGPYAKDGKLRIIKAGVNKFKTAAERQIAIREFMSGEIYLLKEKGYNPISNKFELAANAQVFVHPKTRFLDALNAALKKLDGAAETIYDARSVVKYVSVAANQLDYSLMHVGDVTTAHLSYLLDYMQQHNISAEPKPGKEKIPFTNVKYNRYRANLVMLYKRIWKMGAVPANHAEGIDTKPVVKKIRQTLTVFERKQIDKRLRKDNPQLHRLMHIFYHAGVRRTEIMKVQGKDVDLDNQRYKATILKGGLYEEVWKIIKDIALPFWKEAIEGCGPEDYVFSVGLKPGPKAINPKQVTRRWKLWVKDKLFIDADFYALKHLNTTEVMDRLGAQKAADLNSHKSEAMVVKIYDVKREERQARKDEELKSIDNPFVSNG